MSDPNIDKYLKEVEEDNDNIEAHFNLGKIYFKNQFIDLAMEEFNQVIRIDPDHTGSYIYSSQIYYLKGDNHMALEDLKEALGL